MTPSQHSHDYSVHGSAEDDLADFFDNAAIPLHWVDAQGVLVRVNDAELRMLGYAREEYLGRNIAEFHLDPSIVAEILRRLAAGETLREYPARLRAKDGSTRHVRITSNARRHKGEFLHSRCITRELDTDYTDLQSRLAAIVESSDDAIVSKSLTGIIQSWNKGAEMLFGYTAQEAVGRHISSLIIPEELQQEEETIIARLRAGERLDHYETTRVAKDGTRLEVSLTISPVRNRDGQITGASKIARNITAQKRAEQTLREADRRKDEFLAVLAHELRNPLAPIRSSLELLELGNEEHALRARTIIKRQVNHMVRLVDDLLEVSRISQGKIQVRTEPVDISAVILSAIETSRPAIEAGRHELKITLAMEPLTVRGDFVRLGQVIANLLNNAAKFTDSGGTVSIGARAENGQAVIEVRDSGAGIEPDMLGRIFDMFVQVDGRGHRAKGGLGIGLALARRLVELHGGAIRAMSKGRGQGATFEVCLPLMPAATLRKPAELPGAPTSFQPRKRVLLVDDNVDAAESLAMLLISMGHEVRVVHNGPAAIEAAQAERPDIVLLDIGMPGMDGREVVKRLRGQPEFRDVRIAAVSGFGQESDILRSKEAGFDEHLVKPVPPETLSALLAKQGR